MTDPPPNDERQPNAEIPHAVRPLDRVQRWMQAVIMHPAGVLAGINSDSARAEIPIDPARIEQIIGRSQALGSLDRLAVYANAYYARLLECLREVFPIVCRTMGTDIFDHFALSYLQKYPSQSYTLNDLGARFAQFLDETRPPTPAEAAPNALQADDLPDLSADWPRFVVDLAALEWTIGEVYDSPGVEKTGSMQRQDLESIPPDRRMSAHLQLAPCVRLLEFRFPANDFYARMRELPYERDRERDGEVNGGEDNGAEAVAGELPIPPPAPTYLALSRRNYVVRRYPLDRIQFELLNELSKGKTIAEALSVAAADCDLSDDELAARLHEWFAQWTANQFFLSVSLD